MPKNKNAAMLKTDPNRMGSDVSIITRNVNLIFTQLLITLFCLFLAQNMALAQSDFQSDLKLSLNGRTYPIGTQIVGALGVSYPVWGNTQSWKYGYLRGGLNLMTSGVVNRAGLEFQFFPISIFGVTLGYDTGVRNYVPKWVDCNLYECTGRSDRKQIRLNFVAAHSGVSFLMVARYEELRGYSNSSKPVFDETTILFGKKSGENILTWSPALLYDVSEHTKVGLISLYSRALDTGGYSHLYGPIVNLNPEPKFNALFGVGLNSSPIAHSAICGFFTLQYNIKPSMSVMDLGLRNSTQDVSESLKQ